LEALEPEWISGFDLARDADVLIHDCQYTDEEYPEHVGWGHSRLTDALTFARRVEARRLLLFHHDPLHPDDFLDRFHETARERWAELGGPDGAVDMAAEAQQIQVDAAAGVPAAT
jgi:ribonuclease BN (tRNA processing enzyme)